MTEGDRSACRETAYVALFDACYSRVLAYTSRRLGRDAGADAAADAFIIAWLKLEQLEGDPLIWMYGLARGVVANHRRRLQRAQRLEDRSRVLSVARSRGDPADEVTWRDAVSAALAMLGQQDREVLALVAWEGLNSIEGAAVLGCSPGAFKVRLHRARRRLRRYLDADPVAEESGRVPVGDQATAASAPLPIVEEDNPCH